MKSNPYKNYIGLKFSPLCPLTANFIQIGQLLYTVLRHIFVHMVFVASVFEAIYFMFKIKYMGGNLHQKKALSM